MRAWAALGWESLLYTVLSELQQWHPLYLYVRVSAYEAYRPYRHQLVFLADSALRPVVRVLVGDEVGLGKTIEAILVLRVLEARLAERGRKPRFLIIVPRILVDQWVSELRRTGVDRYLIRVLLSGDDVREAVYRDEPGYYVASLQLLRRRGVSEEVQSVEWDAIVVDEAHNVGLGGGCSSPTLSYRLVHGLTRSSNTSVVLLSATPHRGKTRDYLARLLLLVPGLGFGELCRALGELDDPGFYRATHRTLLYRRTKEAVNALEGERVFRPARLQALLVEVSEEEKAFEDSLMKFLSRKLGEWGREVWERRSPKGLLLALIMKRASSSVYAARRTLSVILTGLAARTGRAGGAGLARLREALAAGFDELEGDPEDILEEALAALPSGLFTERDLEELRNIVRLAGEVEARGEAKLEALAELVKRHVREGRHVVVFTEYRDTLDYLYGRFRRMLPGYRIACISGAASGECSRERIEEVKRLLASGELDVLLATDVASEGLNLQAASVLVNYDVPWSPVKLEQRIGRVWRIRQREEVLVYTMFRNTESDLLIVDKLYSKILAIKRAIEGARPLIGSRVAVYAEGVVHSIDQMYVGGVAGASDAVAEAFGDEGELAIARAILEGGRGLDEIAARIIARINELRREIEAKGIYPLRQGVEEDRLALAAIGVEESPVEVIGKQAVRLAKLLGIDHLARMGDPEKLFRVFRSALVRLRAEGAARTWGAVYQSPAVGEKLVIVPVKIVAEDGAVVYRELVGLVLEDSKVKRVLRGQALLDTVLDIIDAGVEAVPRKPADVLRGVEQLLAKIHAERELRRRLASLQQRLEKLRRELEKRVSVGEEWLRLPQAKADISEAIVVVKGPAPRGARAAAGIRRAASVEEGEALEERLTTERKALMLVMRYEVDQGRLPRDVHEERPYDIESRDPVTNEVLRYIEVKSHRGFEAVIELTEREYMFAKQHRDKYWLYLVLGVDTEKPIIITIHDPLSKLRLQPVRKRIVTEREETRYIAQVDIGTLKNIES